MALSGNRKRSEVVTVTFSKTEKKRLERAAKQSGVPLTVWIRQLVRHITDPPKEE